MRRAIVVGLVCLSAATAPGAARAGGPIWGKDMVQGGDFPPPFGISAVYFSQEQEYEVEKLTVGVPGFQNLPTDLLQIDNELDELNVKFDAWLLPYLNVFGLLGTLDGKTDVDFSALGPAPQPLPFSRITIEYDGEVYGAGAVLAGGVQRFFGSLTAIYTNTSLSGDFESSADAFVLTPRVGLFNRHGSIYVGAMYLEATEEHEGTVGLPLVPGLPPIPVAFEVDLVQKDDWNWVVGATAALGKNWTLQAEGGFGDREHIDIELGFRF
jgi:hypothetical protein